ncbi:MAG: substrate-binding domain-containing protein, partial [Planctomycetales bacterium]|nr:substrate-binding domain-containing protein [Planctomycetales bacterium]
RAAKRVGLAVPRDLSVIGFDDIDLAQYMTPALTTIRFGIAHLGRTAARQLLLVGNQSPSRHAATEQGCEVRIRTELVVRETTAPPLSSDQTD